MKNSKENRGSDRELVGVREKTPAASKEGSHRVQRVEREIREVVGAYLISGFKGPLPGLVSISRVICSKDLRTAKIFVTLLSFGAPATSSETENSKVSRQEEADRERAIEVLQAHAFEVQSEINRRLKMKHCPKISFLYDDGYENVMKVEKILRDLSEEKARAAAKANSSQVNSSQVNSSEANSSED